MKMTRKRAPIYSLSHVGILVRSQLASPDYQMFQELLQAKYRRFLIKRLMGKSGHREIGFDLLFVVSSRRVEDRRNADRFIIDQVELMQVKHHIPEVSWVSHGCVEQSSPHRS